MRDPSLLIGGRSRNEARGQTSPRSKLGEHIATLDFTKMSIGALPSSREYGITASSSGVQPIAPYLGSNTVSYPYTRGVALNPGNNSISTLIALPTWDYSEAQVECIFFASANCSVSINAGFVHTASIQDREGELGGGAAVDSGGNDSYRWARRFNPGIPYPGYAPDEFGRLVCARIRRYALSGNGINPVGRNPRDSLGRIVKPALLFGANGGGSGGGFFFIFKIHLFRRERESQ